MLNDEFCVKYDTAREWNDKTGKLELSYPEFPTLKNVLQQAEVINNFVSETK